ncbi:MAG TPA: choice-of-anchor tandem repeat GloVer-containing protein [Bryocella sp.]|nr:choice-of-anchor tandem repeat GloVer-containing protein [Bryocella sp.]
MYQSGNVFTLTQSNASWTYTDLYDFTGGNDGANPVGSLILDGNGNLYGATLRGGSSTNCFAGCGVLFEITP